MAEYTIKRNDLVAALDAVKGAVPKKSMTQILTHVLIEESSIYGFDSEIGVKAKLECSPELRFNVPFEKFNNLIRGLNESEVVFALDGKKVTLKCGRHQSVMQQIIEDTFPKPHYEDGVWKQVPTGFKEALERALLATSDREQEKILSSVMIQKAVIVSTDRTKLVRCVLESPLQDDPILLARKAVTEIIRLGNPIKMMVSGAWSVWDYGNLTFMARLREGAREFPDVNRLFDSIKPTADELVPDGLVGILQRLKLFSEDKAFTVRDGFGKTELVAQGETANAVETIDSMKVIESKKFPCDPLAEAAPYAEQMNWMGKGMPMYMKGQNFEFLLSPVIVGA